MEVKSSSKATGIGFLGLLVVAFIVLKLCNIITWTWFWVLSPIWIPTAFVMGILTFVFIVWVIRALIKSHRRNALKR